MGEKMVEGESGSRKRSQARKMSLTASSGFLLGLRVGMVKETYAAIVAGLAAYVLIGGLIFWLAMDDE